MIATTEIAKKVTTKDAKGKENGFIVELLKTGAKTAAYLTTIELGSVKGYHLHRIRSATLIPIRGQTVVTLYKPGTVEIEQHILDAEYPTRLHIPPNVATSLKATGMSNSWLINFPDPAYDSLVKDEQVEYTLDELNKGKVK